MALGDNVATIKHSGPAVKVDPQFAPGWEVLARDALDKGQVDEALAYVERALAIDPDFGYAHTTKGRTLAQAGSRRQRSFP